MSAEEKWEMKYAGEGFRVESPEQAFYLQEGTGDTDADLLARLLNEREKYRAALEQIAAEDYGGPNGYGAVLIAEEALKP